MSIAFVSEYMNSATRCLTVCARFLSAPLSLSVFPRASDLIRFQRASDFIYFLRAFDFMQCPRASDLIHFPRASDLIYLLLLA